MKPGVDEANRITPLAETNFRDQRTMFGIKRPDRRMPMLVLGKTGMGKSTLLENIIVADIKAGEGLAVIDPHGDLVERVLDHIPEPRVNDVIYFHPADVAHPIALNPLEDGDPHHRALIASGLISVFKKIWIDSWGPRTEHILRHALLSLLSIPSSTLLDVPRLLANRDYRLNVIEKVDDPELKAFWLSEFERYSARFRSEAISPIQNKLGQFTASPLIRNIIGQPKSAFDMRAIMDNGKILLVNLCKGKIGEDVSSLLGAILITRAWLSALSRADLSEEERRDFYLIVDEVHSFATASFSDLLSEARKYKLNVLMASQFFDQLDERVRAAALGNAGTLIAFQVGAEDAAYLAREFYPAVREVDLINLPRHHIYLKLMIDGVTSPPFSAVTLPPPEEKANLKRKIIAGSRRRYTRAAKLVERELLLRRRQPETESPAGPAQAKLFS